MDKKKLSETAKWVARDNGAVYRRCEMLEKSRAFRLVSDEEAAELLAASGAGAKAIRALGLSASKAARRKPATADQEPDDPTEDDTLVDEIDQVLNQ